MFLTFGYKTWSFLNWIHLLGRKDIKSQDCLRGLFLSPCYVEASESSVVQEVWGRVLWSLVPTGHHDVVIAWVAMFSWRQETWSPRQAQRLGPSLGWSLLPRLLTPKAAIWEGTPLLGTQRSSEFLLPMETAKPHPPGTSGSGEWYKPLNFRGRPLPHFKLQVLDLVPIYSELLVKSSSTSLTPKLGFILFWREYKKNTGLWAHNLNSLHMAKRWKRR